MENALQSLVSSIDSYTLQILMNIGIAIILALGLNLITGVTGQLSLGHAAFISIGAFTGGIITTKYNLPFSVSLLIAGIMASTIGAVVGLPIFRLSGDYLAIATLGFAEILKVIFLNLEITNKALGLSVLPPNTHIPLALWVVAICTFAIVAMYLLENSRFGRALRAIREDEIAADAMGINTTRYKVQAFAIGTFYAGVGGALLAHVLTFISPVDFDFDYSVSVLSMVVLGGLGSIPGAILGASILTISPEVLRFMQDYRMLVYGALLVFLMVFRPNGLLGGINFTRLVLRTLGIRKPGAKTSAKPTSSPLKSDSIDY